MPDQNFINERERELLDLERELNERLSHDFEAERPGIDSAVGRLSFIDAHQQHQMDLNAQRRSAAQLASVRAALERIDKGTYGICQRCGVEILPERLEYLPDTPFCTACNVT
jgi:RNA polymerase-binding transcription factor DksA